MKPIRLMSGFFTVGVWTLLSRVLGFLREVLLLSLIGPGPVMDAFVAAFRLPNMFRRFFAEGAFNAAFVPMFAKKLEGEEGAGTFARDAFNGLSLAVLALTALGMIFMPGLVWLTAEGFVGDPRFDMTVAFGRIAFPYILCMSLSALFSGILNATGRFAVAAAAPVLLNIFVIAAMTFAALTGGEVALWLIWSIPVAGVAQLALTWRAAAQAGFPLRPSRPRWTPDMRAMIVIALPAALASGVMQINLVVGQLVASQYDKAVSWLFAADRLYQLPLGVVGIAVGIVLLPDLSRRLRAGDDAGAQTALSRAAEISLALTIPSSVALIVIPFALVTVLFERGASGVDDTAAIATAVMVYGLGLPSFVLQKILQPVYFAREDTRRPFHFAVIAMVVNAALAIGLAPFIGWIAPAVATTLAGWAMFACLAIGARRFGDAVKFDARFHKRIWRILIASVAMGGALWLGNAALQPMLGLPWWRGLALVLLLIIAALSYFGVGQLIGAFRLSEFKSAMRRG
ncbi:MULTISPECIES: murein biosynthesis integral membrane protein MurJ [Sulfitobacter]|uniref:murein biosynthesis integral membrane protein MurJ n=1 Tax=Sulfitobacter TaxID=60136 RepID=UPI002307C9D9|nr:MULTISPECIES: murein biosynthesis integral membrane protein MurJ [Sulfitobacter]MDF3384317.1 murein biosynthesis integral membrane protein MurJ [Sulfitobacter sp. Ks11]MDF3387735.1 murein biosynthesis integral membrane protein MurJ [Sulfitobacter sp. M85]MDF3391155.1 murein biosynthesis integral membrane protein MurJ [Sulfitobacter sp. Ks16]MDF3401793.1 murein biosynthesis integral membrane protein MurJ [Sulfitobacter sp. KE39]MDF3405214.1 murein biosynthesis integral membrane protein MurJ 